MNKKIIASVAFAFAAAILNQAHAADFDETAAKALAKKNDCFKCHAPDKTKKGPAYRDVAFKYAGKADAEEKLIKNITTGPKVILEDCSEEEHKIIDSKDQAAIKNLIGWILSLKGGVERQSASVKCKG